MFPTDHLPFHPLPNTALRNHHPQLTTTFLPCFSRLAKIIAYAESIQTYLENITYQMCQMTHDQRNRHLAGPIGLFKMFATRAAHEIADEAVNIFGGRGLTTTGMGRSVEMFHRTYKFDAILGGTEEILGDLGVRLAMKGMPKAML